MFLLLVDDVACSLIVFMVLLLLRGDFFERRPIKGKDEKRLNYENVPNFKCLRTYPNSYL